MFARPAAFLPVLMFACTTVPTRDCPPNMTLRGAAPAESIAAAGLKPQPAPASVDDFLQWNSIGVHWTVRRERDAVSFYRYGWGCPPLGPVAPVKIDTGKYPRGLSQAFVTDDGYLLSYNGGEWGGDLYWSSKDGQRLEHVYKGLPVLGVFERRGRHVAVAGVAHMGSDIGVLLELSDIREHPIRVERELKLAHAPDAVGMAPDGALIIATTSDVLRLGPTDDEPVVLKEHDGMGFLYPNSIAFADDGTIFIGMRYYVVEILPDLSENWYASLSPQGDSACACGS